MALSGSWKARGDATCSLFFIYISYVTSQRFRVFEVNHWQVLVMRNIITIAFKYCIEKTLWMHGHPFFVNILDNLHSARRFTTFDTRSNDLWKTNAETSHLDSAIRFYCPQQSFSRCLGISSKNPRYRRDYNETGFVYRFDFGLLSRFIWSPISLYSRRGDWNIVRVSSPYQHLDNASA